MKTWYSARLLFRADVDDGSKEEPLFEESTRVLLAEDEDEAARRAPVVGASGEHQYKNEAGNTVHWKFIEVLEIQDLSETELSDGVEVFSRMYRGEQ